MQVALRRHAALFASVLLIIAWVLLVMVAGTMLTSRHSRSIPATRTVLSKHLVIWPTASSRWQAMVQPSKRSLSRGRRT